MKRTMLITDKNEAKIARSFAMVKFMVGGAIIEYQQYLDVDFRSPSVHSGLKRAIEGMQGAVNHINKTFLSSNNPEEVEGVEFKLHELMKGVMRLDEPQLDALLVIVQDKVNSNSQEEISTKNQS